MVRSLWSDYADVSITSLVEEVRREVAKLVIFQAKPAALVGGAPAAKARLRSCGSKSGRLRREQLKTQAWKECRSNAYFRRRR
jgi:hypothetical protein